MVYYLVIIFSYIDITIMFLIKSFGAGELDLPSKTQVDDSEMSDDVHEAKDKTKFVPEVDVITSRLMGKPKVIPVSETAQVEDLSKDFQKKIIACKEQAAQANKEALLDGTRKKAETGAVPPCGCLLEQAVVPYVSTPTSIPPLHPVKGLPATCNVALIEKAFKQCMLNQKGISLAELQKAFVQCGVGGGIPKEEKLSVISNVIEEHKQPPQKEENLNVSSNSFGRCSQHQKDGGFMSSAHNGRSSCNNIEGKDFCYATCNKGQTSCIIGDDRPCECTSQDGFHCSCRIYKGVCTCTFKPLSGNDLDMYIPVPLNPAPRDLRSDFTRFMEYVFIPMDCTPNCENNNSDMYFSTMALSLAVFLIRLHSY